MPIRVRHRSHGSFALLSLLLSWGCDNATSVGVGRKLSVEEEQSSPDVPAGSFQQRLGAVAPLAKIRAAPNRNAPLIGTLIAGDRVPRSESPHGTEGCPAGWYAIEPRGYVCLDETTTLDESHPTLVARAMAANHSNALPYPYAITRRETSLYEPDPKRLDGVRERRKLPKGSFFAVVGSWDPLDEYDQRLRLAMLTTGRFVSVRDIAPVQFPSSPGVLLHPSTYRLPLALITAKEPTGLTSLTAGRTVNLTGRSSLAEKERCWALTTDGCIHESDAVIVRPRQEVPAFAAKATHWAEFDLAHDTLLLYEGKSPVFVTLLVRSPASLAKSGVTYLQSKQITAASNSTTASGSGERLDLAWVLELSSGLTVRATTTPGIYGERHAENAIELHPDDAHRLFDWLAPSVPVSWHGLTLTAPERESSPILLL